MTKCFFLYFLVNQSAIILDKFMLEIEALQEARLEKEMFARMVSLIPGLDWFNFIFFPPVLLKEEWI